jgi:ankyrin repeat protein
MELDDVNKTDRYGRTMLHIAAENGNKSKVMMLIEHGAEIDLGDDTDKTALHYAVLNGHTSIINILLEEGCDANARDENGCTPILLVRRNVEKIIPLLMNFDADIEAKNLEGKTLLNIAAEKRDKDFVTLLIRIGFDVNTQDASEMTPLLNAAKAKNYDVIDVLLNYKDNDENHLVNVNHTTSQGVKLTDFIDKQELEERISIPVLIAE